MQYHFLNLHDVVTIVSILESIFLFAFFWLMPGAQPLARRVLAILFLLGAGMLSSTLVIWNSYLQTSAIARAPIAPLVFTICVLLEGPTLYFYLMSLSRRTNLWRWTNAVHLIPALVCVAVILIFNITVKEWLPSHWRALPTNTAAAVTFVWAVFKCLPTVYIAACFYAEYRLRQDLKQMYSSISRLELMVADIVLSGFFLRWLWACGGYLLSSHISVETNSLIGDISDYLVAVFVNTLCVFGLINTRQLLNVAPVEEGVKQEAELPQEKIAVIEQSIHVRKLYLESNINLERFAEQVGLRPRDVSNIINSHYRSNFFEFINGFRVEEAKRLLIAKNSTDSILDIAYKSGFNSQSAFHRFFKRIVGITPSEYRAREKAAIGGDKTQ